LPGGNGTQYVSRGGIPAVGGARVHPTFAALTVAVPASCLAPSLNSQQHPLDFFPYCYSKLPPRNDKGRVDIVFYKVFYKV